MVQEGKKGLEPAVSALRSEAELRAFYSTHRRSLSWTNWGKMLIVLLPDADVSKLDKSVQVEAHDDCLVVHLSGGLSNPYSRISQQDLVLAIDDKQWHGKLKDKMGDMSTWPLDTVKYIECEHRKEGTSSEANEREMYLSWVNEDLYPPQDDGKVVRLKDKK